MSPLTKKYWQRVVVAISFIALSLTPLTAATLYPVLVGDRWGYIDKSGNIVINPQFERAGTFSSGLAAVRLGKWGYVDQSGKLVINPQFDEATAFQGGLAAVRFSGRYGFINPEGKYVVNPQFDGAGS